MKVIDRLTQLDGIIEMNEHNFMELIGDTTKLLKKYRMLKAENIELIKLIKKLKPFVKTSTLQKLYPASNLNLNREANILREEINQILEKHQSDLST